MKFNNKNISIGKNVVIGKNVKIGDNTIIYDNVVIDDDTIISNDCVLGEPTADYYTNNSYTNEPLYIGKNSLIRSHAVIYAGSNLGDYLQTGHRVTVREKTVCGNHCMFGSYVDIQGHCNMGNYTRFHSYVNIGQKSIIGNYVFLYPFVVLTNDPTPPSNDLIGVFIDDFSQITTASIILPGAHIGKHCLVAANSVVGGKFEDDTFINGNPAKAIGKLSKMPFFNKNGKRHYPWPKNFKRNMPWENNNLT